MNKLFLLAIFAVVSYANDTIVQPKKCEIIKLSNFTTLVSCDKLDYIVQTKESRRDDEDNMKKITVLSEKENKIIINK
ncbi:hypothetical protein CRU98_09205 [Arcobacter sp. CECT 8986]|uniref:hypothetical protein n=1 Tax=Arcobacter sp. CECT 8986 TaxID=2044507 RepID=UPI001009929A|nr:hypothetical protein [Arcobacter sp. CECT 8986]RXJ98539.1 hypothetical protein CRU98_09205 [Arcobacter sp. CECT 8986]